MEDKVLASKMEHFKTEQRENEDEMVLSSSIELFLFYRQTLANCGRLSTKKVFLDLVKMYQKWLDAYMHVIIQKFPREERRPSLEDIRVACIIINTSDYCFTTIEQLEERVIDTIDKELRSLITFQAELDSFMSTSSTGLQLLVKLVENTTEAHFLSMARRPWSTLASVGDQSEHITQFAQTLSPIIQLIRKMFSGSKFFKIFCDKFTE